MVTAILNIVLLIARIAGYILSKKSDEREKYRKLLESFKNLGIEESKTPKAVKDSIDTQKERMRRLLETYKGKK